MRYVVVAFFFLGLVFFEMSGGADFDPEAARQARIDARPAPETADVSVAVVQTARELPENVTRIDLNLNSVEDVAKPRRRLPTERARRLATPETERVPLSEEPPAEFLPSLVGDPAVDDANFVDSSAITVVDFSNDIASLLPRVARQGGETPVTASDIRSVTGNSVNVRGGPGTDYAVVNRLSLGDEVEVLQDPGEGWVQLRPLNGSAVGWMASFLLTEG